MWHLRNFFPSINDFLHEKENRYNLLKNLDLIDFSNREYMTYYLFENTIHKMYESIQKLQYLGRDSSMRSPWHRGPMELSCYFILKLWYTCTLQCTVKIVMQINCRAFTTINWFWNTKCLQLDYRVRHIFWPTFKAFKTRKAGQSIFHTLYLNLLNFHGL